jgi:uncharacterized membrane protein
MPTVQLSVDLNVDVTTAYRQWTRFEDFSQWMEGVARVERTDATTLRWVAKVRNEFATTPDETREWDARITEQARDRRIAWESVGGESDDAPSGGEASFEPLGESSCRVTFRMHWEPEGGLETPDQVLDAVRHVVAADLERFKGLIEGHQAGSPPGERLLEATTH